MGDLWYNEVTSISSRGAALTAPGLGNCHGRTATMSDHTADALRVKVCTKCGEAKPITEFHRQAHSPDGLHPACKSCTNAQNRSIYKAHKLAHLEAKRRYRAQNPDARLATIRKYDAINAMARKAHRAVRHAIAVGDIRPVHECVCQRCGNQAEVYHHESYEPERWLDVQPLCRVCHGEIHRVS